MTISASDYQRFVFDNGLRLIVIPLAGLESATILVMVGAGSRYETAPINGASHFL
jgi:predicted Zn-dependent peptidase